MTELLLTKGAEVNNKTFKKGYTPLCYAEDKGYDNVAELLRRHGGRVPSRIQKVTKPTSPIQIDIANALKRASAFATERAYIEVCGPDDLLKDLWHVKGYLNGLLDDCFPNASFGNVKCTLKTSAIVIKNALEVLELTLHALNDMDALTFSTVDWLTAEVISDLESTAVWQEGKRTHVWPLEGNR